MRIAYVINSLEGGGAALPVPVVTGLLRELGADVRLFALSRRDGRAAAALDAAGLDYRVSEAGKAEHLAAARWVFTELREYRPTIIWTSLTQATLIGQVMGKLLRVPVVSWQHNAFLKPANLAWLKRTRALTRLWIADSRSVAQLSIERLGVSPEHMVVWPLIIASRPDRALPRYKPGEVFRIGSLGRLHPNKGYDTLIEALAHLSREYPALCERFEVVVGGEGSERAALEEKARNAGVHNFVLAGYQDRPSDFLARCHAYVQPSRAEGLCIAAHEAMQAGLPVIVSSVGEMPFTVEHGKSGLIVASGDDAALAIAIQILVSNPLVARQMGTAAQDRVVEKFGIEEFREAGTAIFDRIAAWPVRY